MLESVKIARRQSEIRQSLSELVAKDAPSEDETRAMETLDAEYRQNETRYRAALIAEDTERREAGGEMETRSAQEWADMLAGFELRQVAMALDTGHQLEGQTAEIVSELRSADGFRGIPVPWEALEVRAGETAASGTPDPVATRPIIDRLFPQSVAGRMGAQMVNIGVGEVEWPVATSAVSAGWADGETGTVASPTAYATTDRPLAPDHTLGVQMKITRKTLKQSGAALEAAVRRDLNGAMAQAMDAAVVLGSGASGEPTGIFPGASGFGITETAIDAAASWSAFREAVVRFGLDPVAPWMGVAPLKRAQLDEGAVIVLAGAGHAPAQDLRKLGLLAPGALDVLGLACDEIARRDGGDRGRAAHPEADHALALDGVEAEVAGEHGGRVSRALDGRNHQPLDRAPEAGDVDMRGVHAGSEAEVANERGEPDRPEATRQPVAELPVGAVGPDIGERREEGMRAGVPGPALNRVSVLKPVTPVGKRHVVVDADEIDVAARPERIKVEEHVTRAITRMVAEVFRPVGGIADGGPRTYAR